MKVGPRRRQHAKDARVAREFRVLGRRVTARYYLDGIASGVAELREQLAHLPVDLVSSWMREYRLAACRVYPSDCLRERCPLMRHVARFATDQVAPKAIPGVASMSGLDQKPGKMGAADEARAGAEPHRAGVRIGDAGRAKLFTHALRAMRAAGPYGLETLAQGGAVGVDAERHDVQRDVTPAYRELGAVDEAHSRFLRGRARFAKAAGLIVIGQRQHVDAARARPSGDFRRLEQTVGIGRVAVQIVAQRHGVPKAWSVWRLTISTSGPPAGWRLLGSGGCGSIGGRRGGRGA